MMVVFTYLVGCPVMFVLAAVLLLAEVIGSWLFHKLSGEDIDEEHKFPKDACIKMSFAIVLIGVLVFYIRGVFFT